MKKNKTKLTSVIVLEDIYEKFKTTKIDGGINLQKLVNRALDLYNTKEEFRGIINKHNHITENNPKF